MDGEILHAGREITMPLVGFRGREYSSMCKVRWGWLPVLLGVSLFACGHADTPLPVIDAHVAAGPASFGDNRAELH